MNIKDIENILENIEIDVKNRDFPKELIDHVYNELYIIDKGIQGMTEIYKAATPAEKMLMKTYGDK